MKRTFYSTYSLEFEEYLDSFLVKLQSKMSKYRNILLEIEGLKEQYPNLRIFLENRENISLNEDERNALLRILDLQDEQKIYEYKELFFRGASEFKNIRMML